VPDELPAEEVSRLCAAEGWLELGLPSDAAEELENISPGAAEHPLVLMVRWRVLAALEEWEECFTIGKKLVEIDPDEAFGWIHRSYALHELKRTREASEWLAPALSKFPEEELVAYNLACYACQLGELEEAKALLKTCVERSDAKVIKARALEDPDLAALHSYIKKM
jgi:tetratricopeptide (TPR) repeat protein